MSYEALMDDIKKLPQDQLEFVVKIVESLPKETSVSVNEEIVKKTDLSSKRRKFLETAGKIDIDEDAVDDLRMRSII